MGPDCADLSKEELFITVAPQRSPDFWLRPKSTASKKSRASSSSLRGNLDVRSYEQLLASLVVDLKPHNISTAFRMLMIGISYVHNLLI
jgi:hypothetical protein